MSNDPLNVIVARVETKLDGLIAMRLDHEQRLRSLEDSRSQARGITAAISFIASGLGILVGWVIEHFARKAANP